MSRNPSYVLNFNIIDKLTEEAAKMIYGQKNRTECIRTMLIDFAKANNFIDGYTKIPRKERLERCFGYSGYTEKAAGTLQPDKMEDKRLCRFQFDFNPYRCERREAAFTAFMMLHYQDNASLFIRELFLDFVTANGKIENYVAIPEDERLRKFFGYVERTMVPVGQSGRTAKVMRDKNIEVLQYYEGTRYLFSEVAYTAPDGRRGSLSV